ncbi:MAG: TIM44-like domain-containing protein [Pelistega sp.]|nr:TIM44-like domain-containing protein [Pelistega sp.]
MSKKWSKFVSAAVIVLSSAVMFTVTADAEARRMGGGSSFGRQSTQINRTPATQAPATPAARSAAAPAAGAAAGTAAAAQRSGMSRFLGPIAGIAAGLGIAALLSSLGLGGALLEFLSSAILIGLVIFGIMFIVRRLRGGAQRPAFQGAGQGTNQGAMRHSDNLRTPEPMQRNDFGAQNAQNTQPFTPASASIPAATTEVAQPVDTSWYIPADFNTVAFLQEAKKQFAHVQAIWDKGDVEQLRAYLTDDLVKELSPQITENAGRTKTDIVLLNAELLGMEQVADGHLASVRFSGMLREEANQAAFRFEEVWNLYKTDNSGWLLAGIQQIPVEN